MCLLLSLLFCFATIPFFNAFQPGFWVHLEAGAGIFGGVAFTWAFSSLLFFMGFLFEGGCVVLLWKLVRRQYHELEGLLLL